MRHPRGAAVRRLVLAVSFLFALSATYARAELVVMQDGRVVKAASTHVAGDSLEIRLLGGGSFSVDRARVEQIVEDEVAPGDMPPPVVAETLRVKSQPRRAEAPPPPPQPYLAPPPTQEQPERRREHEEKSKANKSANVGGRHRGTGH